MSARPHRAFAALLVLAALPACQRDASLIHQVQLEFGARALEPLPAGRDSLEVSLPAIASGPMRVGGVEVRLRGADATPARLADGYTVHPGALGGADLIRLRLPHGVEDWVRFRERPPREELAYAFDPGATAGLRLVGNTLELLDARGTPRLRVAPPSIKDAAGAEREARLELEGCAADRDPRPPWHRAVVAPGAASCVLLVRWDGQGVVYPALLDPAWLATGIMSRRRSNHTVTQLRSGLVLAAGGSNAAGNTELFDPTTRTWSPTGMLTFSRYNHVATALPDGRAMVAGGNVNLFSYLSQTELYNPMTGMWSPGPPLPGAISYQAAVTLPNGKLLVSGGFFQQTRTYLSLYDPVANSWSSGALQAPRYLHTMTVLQDGGVLVTGGYNTDYIATVEVVDPAALTATTVAPLGAPRAYHSAALLDDGRVLVAGGRAAANHPVTELYDPATGQWSDAGVIAFPRFHQRIAPVPGGAMLIGGTQPSGCPCAIDSVERFFIDGGWGTERMLLTPRAQAAITVLDGGTVLISGGVNASNVELSTAEVFGSLSLGSPCTAADDCQSGFCADRVCCDSACGEACGTCGANGACTAVAAGTFAPNKPPCTSDGTVCGGSCDGTRTTCVYPAVSCGTQSCLFGEQRPEAQCAGGRCVAASMPMRCAPFTCGATACKTSCSGPADCTAATYCEGSACVPRKALGASCTGGAQCSSGFCADGVCCDGACDGQCERCAAGGRCGPNSGAPAGGRPACAGGGDVCAGACDGVARRACSYPSGASCREARCENGVEVGAAVCVGTGSCPPEERFACAPYSCGAAACRSSCAADAECAAGRFCVNGACLLPREGFAGCTSAGQCASGFCVRGQCCPACDGGPCAQSCTEQLTTTHGCAAAPGGGLFVALLALVRGSRRGRAAGRS